MRLTTPAQKHRTFGYEKNIQKMTDNKVLNIDKIFSDKEKEILQI